MFEILTVCTGNVCRSPLAALLLEARLAPLGVRVVSAGTRALVGAGMTPESVRLATDRGIPPAAAAAHRSRLLSPALLATPDLVLTMTREHRRLVVEMAPERVRSTFTIREFARLSADATTAELREATGRVTPDAASRVRAAASVVASHRGLAAAPRDPGGDDVIDPYGRSWSTYERSAAQLYPAIDAVVHTLWIALAPPIAGTSSPV